MGAEHCTDTAADPRPRVCQLAVRTSCGRVTKRWPEISLRLHLVLDSEKEVDLPTEPTHTLRRDQPRTFSRSARVTQPASLQTYQRADRTDHTFLNPLPTYLPDPPTYQSSSASVLASESERKLTRDQSSRASQRSVSASCSHPSFSPFILRFSVLVVSATVSKGNQKSNPLTSSCWWWERIDRLFLNSCILGIWWL